MHVVPLGAWDQLAVSWGTDVIYLGTTAGAGGAAPVTTLNTGYSRPSVGGITQLTVSASESGLALFPRAAPSLGAKAIKLPINKGATYPFPPAWAVLFETAFVPIYNLLDLHNAALLTTGTASQTLSHPLLLFLLVPSTYAKADAPGLGTDSLAQYPSDARTSPFAVPDSAKAELLMRRFGIMGTNACVIATTDCEAAVKTDFNKLVAAANDPAISSRPDHVAGFFMNQTAVDIEHHILINGRPLPAIVPDTETWTGVAAQWLQRALISEPIFDGRAAIRVRRSVTGANGLPTLRMTFRFHTIDADVLGAARVGEGDEFDDLSTRLHK